MVQIVWEFTILTEKKAEFERHYSSSGSWAALFRQAKGFKSTHLLRDLHDPRRYFTVDAWDDLDAYERFQEDFATAYEALDR